MHFDIGWFVLNNRDGTFSKLNYETELHDATILPAIGDTIYIEGLMYTVLSRTFNYDNVPNPTIRVNIVLPNALVR